MPQIGPATANSVPACCGAGPVGKALPATAAALHRLFQGVQQVSAGRHARVFDAKCHRRLTARFDRCERRRRGASTASAGSPFLGMSQVCDGCRCARRAGSVAWTCSLQGSALSGVSPGPGTPGWRRSPQKCDSCLERVLRQLRVVSMYGLPASVRCAYAVSFVRKNQKAEHWHFMARQQGFLS